MSIRQAGSEHSPLSGLDELPIHQIGQPIRVVGTTDARAYERYWFSAQDKRGEFLLMTGMGFYPNLGTVDGYAALSYQDHHVSVRAHRSMDEDRSRILVGPIRFENVTPFREWHLTLAPNEYGLDYDLIWRDRKRPVFHRYQPDPAGGRLNQETTGYESFGTIEGRIRVNGRTFTLDSTEVIGSRDHHWGVRNGVGGPLLRDTDRRTTHVGQWAEFESWDLGGRVLYNLGSGTPGATQIVAQEYHLSFDPVTRHVVGATIVNRLATGEVKTITYEQLADRVVYLRTGLYMGPDGKGEPEHDYYHGQYVGEDLVGGATYTTGDAATRIRLAGFDDHLMTVTCDGEQTVGLIEVNNPVPYEWCEAGVPGFFFRSESGQH